MHAPNQFDLLRERRFAPFFWTQFLGAGNDNLFKFAFTMLVTYELPVSWLPKSIAGAVIAALFVLPFVLLSATAGLMWALNRAVFVPRQRAMEAGAGLAGINFGT